MACCQRREFGGPVGWGRLSGPYGKVGSKPRLVLVKVIGGGKGNFGIMCGEGLGRLRDGVCDVVLAQLYRVSD